MDKLILLSQSSLATEQYTVNGVVKNLHYVIKKHPIEFEFALESKPGANGGDFACIALSANLHYDGPEQKEVECIRLKPLEFKGMARPDDRTKYLVHASIAVLSSQHEDMNFRVRFTAHDTRSKKPLAGLTAVSEPIQVISKPEVLDKKNGVRLSRKRKRASPNDAIMKVLAWIEATQAKHTQMLEAQKSDAVEASGKAPREETLAFEYAFNTFVRAYMDVPEEERAVKLRKVSATLDEQKEFALASFVDNAAAMGYSAYTSMDASPSSVGSFENAHFGAVQLAEALQELPGTGGVFDPWGMMAGDGMGEVGMGMMLDGNPHHMAVDGSAY